ncbi:hypothetical protein QOZ73_32730, partial [Pseudomonas aeruginosa]|uniref:hypothetical protein n=1 Tax=Pseudomonas aeruginosa TaxID=287 RepID=UPI003459D0D1
GAGYFHRSFNTPAKSRHSKSFKTQAAVIHVTHPRTASIRDFRLALSQSSWCFSSAIACSLARSESLKSGFLLTTWHRLFHRLRTAAAAAF